MLNITVLVGRLSEDPKVKQFGAGKSVTELTIESESSYKDKSQNWVKKSAFDTVTVWGPQGEAAQKFLRTGSLVACVAHSESRDWQGKKINNLISDRLVFLDKADSNASAKAPLQRAGSRPVTVEDPIAEEDIPF